MRAIEHNHAKDVFQQRYAVDVLHSNRVYRNLRVLGRGKVHRHHSGQIVIAIVAERLGQGANVRFIDVAERIIWTHDLTHSRVDFFVQIVFMVQGVNLNGFSNVLRY